MKDRINTMRGKLLLLITLFIGLETSYGQQTVFDLFRNDVKLADKYYEAKNFQGALELYQSVARKDPTVSEHKLRIARCYYSLKQPQQAIDYYNNYLQEKRTLPWIDIYYYAEAQASRANYDTAIEYYRKYLAKDSNDEMVIRKIWRLNNIQYLYEDSAQFEVRPVSLNTNFGELCAVFYGDGIVFMSNRKEPQLVEKVNASINAPFYKIYYSRILSNSDNGQDIRYDKTSFFDTELSSRFNAGPVAFYDQSRKMVFVSTGTVNGINGTRTLQLFFAEIRDGKWTVTESFPYNSGQYSISDPTISNDGTTLYFSSDMGGGLGGRDLYKSTFVNEKWTRPENLGEAINTQHDEVFPFVQGSRTLYFSSNGHPGMGGLDIFRAAIKPDGYDQPENIGYPINSNCDDFGIILDSLNTHGYFSSNRKEGGYNDDLYAFDMDLQTYPLTISGVIKYKEITWSDSLGLKLMPHAKISLIDNVRNVVVHESISDSRGNFSISIPYASKYVIRVVGEDDDENMAVLEIPKQRKELSDHEIVIVKDIYKQK